MISNKQLNKKFLLILLSIVLFSSIYFAFPAKFYEKPLKSEDNSFFNRLHPSYENLSHLEIIVDGTDPLKDWDSLTLIPNYVDWFSGAGTWGDPYIIHDVYMKPEHYWHGSITIKNTNEYFQIVDCLLLDSTGGLVLDNVTNGKVLNNNFRNHENGIILIDSNANVISGNYIEDNLYGIQLSNSHNNTIYANTAKANIYYGIRLINSDNNKVLNNNASYSHWGGIVAGDCDYTLVDQNMAINNFDIGFSIWGDNNILSDNIAKFNEFGISIEGTNINIIGNSVSFNNRTGLVCTGNFINVSNNIITNNEYGIALYYISNSSISNNNVNDNNIHGISLENIENCSLTNNSLDGCGLLISEDNEKIIFQEKFGKGSVKEAVKL